jgi:nucleotide-binding universal stress UspA family protein
VYLVGVILLRLLTRPADARGSGHDVQITHQQDQGDLMSRHALQRPNGRRTPQGEPRRTLIVGYDGSEESRQAFVAALERAEPDDTVVVVHAYAPVSTWLGTPYYQRALDELIHGGRRLLDELKPLADDTEAEVLFELHEGDAADVLERVAETRGANEILVGSRGLGRFRAVLGSVSQRLVHRAGCPVLVVPHGATTDV